MVTTGLTLTKDLADLKAKLEVINKDIRFQTVNISVRDKSHAEMQETINSVVEANKSKQDRINICCGGKKFTTTKNTFLSAKNSLFEAIVNDPDFDLSQELFFDRSADFFGTILEFLRTGLINYKAFKKEQRKKLLVEAQYFQIIEIIKYLEERCKEIDFVSYEFSGVYSYKGKLAGNNILEDLKNEDLTVGGICACSPGSITIKLNSDWEFKDIDIGGFSGNNKLWYPENGSGAAISTSEDGKEFKKVGKIPSGYGKEIKKIKLTKSIGRYIRFSHSSYLGVGYLKINKLDDE